MAIKIPHSHFVHVGFVSILVFQTFDRMIFGTLTLPGTRWYVMTVRDTQMVLDQKKFENHCSSRSAHELWKKVLSRLYKPGADKRGAVIGSRDREVSYRCRNIHREIAVSTRSMQTHGQAN